MAGFPVYPTYPAELAELHRAMDNFFDFGPNREVDFVEQVCRSLISVVLKNVADITLGPERCR